MKYLPRHKLIWQSLSKTDKFSVFLILIRKYVPILELAFCRSCGRHNYKPMSSNHDRDVVSLTPMFKKFSSIFSFLKSGTVKKFHLQRIATRKKKMLILVPLVRLYRITQKTGKAFRFFLFCLYSTATVIHKMFHMHYSVIFFCSHYTWSEFILGSGND